MLGHADEAPSRTASGGRAIGVLMIHAFAVWVACAATIGVGRAITSMETTLIGHAVAAPVFAVTVSAFYFRRYGYTSPLVTASVVLGFIMLVDFFVVALVINRNLDMFRSVLGTWLPFALIFVAIAATGWVIQNLRHRKVSRTATGS